jgi:hypothetical protein
MVYLGDDIHVKRLKAFEKVADALLLYAIAGDK